MTYRAAIEAAHAGALPPTRVTPEVRLLDDRGLVFPVLMCRERACRPFRKYEPYTRQTCPLCLRIAEGKTTLRVVAGMAWLPATYPIKLHHGICYPAEHRASILADDIGALGSFVERCGDAVACINLRGSAASIPEHFHAQLHDTALPASANTCPAFPLLECPTVTVAGNGQLALYRVEGYPTFAMLLRGPWPQLGRWLVSYLAASNTRPHNFAVAPDKGLFVIPRRRERPLNQENRYGASEMLGLITPVTRPAFEAITAADTVVRALRQCGLADEDERLAAQEHAAWVMNHLGREGAGA